MVSNSIKDKIKNNNCDIFNEIYLHVKSFSLKELDELFDLANGSMQKVTKRQRFLTQSQILVLQSYYDIPSEVFNNLDITPDDAVSITNKYINENILVNNKAPHAIEEFKFYEYLYMYDSGSRIISKHRLEISNNKVKIFKIYPKVDMRDVEKLRSEGFIFSTSMSIIMVLESPITGNNIIYKLQRSSIVGPVLPITYLGHNTLTNNQITGIGFCSRHEVNENDLNEILVTEEMHFEKRNQIIIEQLKKYERKCIQEYDKKIKANKD